jgi:hypothetical protein
MLRIPARFLASLLASALLFTPCSFAFDMSLSPEAVRDAYFLGQRHDEALPYFFEKYRRHLPQPESGPWVATVELFTPFAQAVDFCRLHTFNYSAQDAEEDFLKRPNVLRASIIINFTPSFGYVIEDGPKNASGNKKSNSLRSPDFWKNFSPHLFDGHTEIAPLRVQGHANYFHAYRGGWTMTGATIVLTYDPEKISDPSDVEIMVDTPDGQHVVVPFDLNSVR